MKVLVLQFPYPQKYVKKGTINKQITGSYNVLTPTASSHYMNKDGLIDAYIRKSALLSLDSSVTRANNRLIRQHFSFSKCFEIPLGYTHRLLLEFLLQYRYHHFILISYDQLPIFVRGLDSPWESRVIGLLDCLNSFNWSQKCIRSENIAKERNVHSV